MKATLAGALNQVCATLAASWTQPIEIGGSGGMAKVSWHHFKNALLILLVFVAAAGWLYVIVNERRQNDPMAIVRKHFVFYPEYSQGVWREGQCTHIDTEGCREITYTIPVKRLRSRYFRLARFSRRRWGQNMVLQWRQSELRRDPDTRYTLSSATMLTSLIHRRWENRCPKPASSSNPGAPPSGRKTPRLR